MFVGLPRFSEMFLGVLGSSLGVLLFSLGVLLFSLGLLWPNGGDGHAWLKLVGF